MISDITITITSITLLVGAISSLVIALAKLRSNIKDNLPKALKKQANNNVKIYEILNEMLIKFKCDRVQIYDFHNGERYINGYHALKMSCTYEVVSSKVKPKQNQLQGLPINCQPHFVSSLLDNRYLNIEDINSIKSSMPATYEFKKRQRIKSFYDIILEKGNVPVSFLAIQYCDENHKITKSEEFWLHEYKGKIEELIKK